VMLTVYAECREIMSMSVHSLPETPSPSLNGWLQSHYAVSSNAVQYFIGTIICLFYNGASTLHRFLMKRNAGMDTRTVWQASCGVLGVAVAIAAWLAFNIMMSSTFIIHALLHYLANITALIGLGLGAAGAFYFGSEVTESTTTGKNLASDAGSNTEHRSAHQYTRPHDD